MKNSILYIIVLFVGVLFIAGCEYSFVERPEIVVQEPDPDNPLSFAAEILPIFTSRCLDCHNTGGQAPDLSASNAYNSISSLVNTNDPTSSKIYDYIQPSTSTHAWRKYSAAQAAKVLLWIQEGALNN